MKVKQYASGGIVYTPFISSSGAPQATSQMSSSTPTTSASKSEKDNEWQTKKLLEMVQKNGLISDVNVLMDELKTFHTMAQNMSNSYILGGTQSHDILTHLFDVQKAVNANQRMMKDWEDAQNHAYTEKALGEVAVTPGGNIYVMTEKGIESVTPEEYSKNRGTGVYYDYNEDGTDYLTNDELLDIRNRYVANETSLISNVNAAIGLEHITEQIRTIIKDFGNESRTEYVKRTGNKISQSAWNGMQLLLGEGPDGYYKITQKTERENLDAAVKYLWDSIGSRGKNKLIATVAAKGGNPNNPEEVLSLITDALTMHTDYVTDPSFEKTATEYDPDGDGKGKKGDNKQLTEDELAERYLSGAGAPPPRYEILMTSKSGVPMYAYVQNLGGILNEDGKNAMGDANLEDVFTNAYSLSTDVDKKSITFGDQLIDWADASKIVYDSSTNLQRVYLPARVVNGRIMPDFEMYKTISQLNTNLKDYSAGDIKDFLENNYPDLVYDEENNMIIARNTQLFLTFGAIASTDTFSKDMSKSDWLVHNEDLDKRWQGKYNSLTGFRTNKTVGTKNDVTGNRETKHGIMPWNWGYDFYKGNVFVAVTDPMLASMIHNNQFWDKSLYTNMTQKAEAAHRAQIREQQSQLKFTL